MNWYQQLLIAFCSLLLRTGAASALPLPTLAEVGIWRDEGAGAEVQDFLQKGGDERFTPLATYPYIGYNQQPHWLRLPLSNPTDTTQQYVFYISSPQIAEADFYVFSSPLPARAATRRGSSAALPQSPVHTKGGYLVPKASKALMPRQAHVTLSLPPQSAVTMYAKVRSLALLEIQPQLVSTSEAKNQSFADLLFFSFFFGSILSLLLYNLFLFVSLRDRLYLAYGLYVMTFAVYVAMVSGFGFLFLAEPAKVLPWGKVFELLRCLSLITALRFSQLFLLVAVFTPGLHRLYQLVIGTLLVKAGLGLAGYITPNVADDLLLGLSSLLTAGAGLLVWRRGYEPARIFLLAWGCLITAISVWLLSNLGLLPSTYLVSNAPLIGSTMELILMSLALGKRYNLLREADQKAKFEASEKMRLSNLVRVLCHDVANPLAVIMATSRIALERSHDGDKHKKLWQRIDRASAMLSDMVEQVRQMEAYKAGKLKPNLEPVSLREVFNNMLFMFESRARQKGVALTHNLASADADVHVLADKTMLGSSIISNLVSNALKFTPAGGAIHIEAQPIGEEVELTIRDNGIGMSPSHVEKLFDPGAETSRLGTNLEEGTGFGMPLVKSITESLAGRIAIQSQEASLDSEQQGTKVRLFLPRAVAADEPYPLDKSA